MRAESGAREREAKTTLYSSCCFHTPIYCTCRAVACMSSSRSTSARQQLDATRGHHAVHSISPILHPAVTTPLVLAHSHGTCRQHVHTHHRLTPSASLARRCRASRWQTRPLSTPARAPAFSAYCPYRTLHLSPAGCSQLLNRGVLLRVQTSFLCHLLSSPRLSTTLPPHVHRAVHYTCPPAIPAARPPPATLSSPTDVQHQRLPTHLPTPCRHSHALSSPPHLPPSAQLSHAATRTLRSGLSAIGL